MPRIAGVNLPLNKRVDIGLTYIFGIGRVLSNKILVQAQISPDIRIKDLKQEEINKLHEIIEKGYKIEGDLKREILLNIKRLKEIGSFRGSRLAKCLPSRGQRSKTNARTVKGNVRRTMGSGRKRGAEKT